MINLLLNISAFVIGVAALIGTGLTHLRYRRSLRGYQRQMMEGLRLLAARSDLLAARGVSRPGTCALAQLSHEAVPVNEPDGEPV